MALDAVKNFAKVEVSTGYDASATSIVLVTGGAAKLPAVPFNMTWWNVSDYPDPADDPNVEIVRVTNIATETLTVTRNQESTGASTKNTGGATYNMVVSLTQSVYDSLKQIQTNRSVGVIPFASSASVTTGNGINAITIPADLDTANLTAVMGTVHTKGITGSTTVQIRRRRAGVDADMLSTVLSIGDEFFSSTIIIDAANDDVNEGDQIYADVDSVHSGTAPLGLSLAMTFAKNTATETKVSGLSVTQSTSALVVANGTNGITIPADFNGLDLTDAIASVHDKGITGTTDVQVRRRRAGVDADMLSTVITIADEFYASDGIINTSNDDIATGDQIYIDVDAIHSGTAPNGLSVTLVFS